MSRQSVMLCRVIVGVVLEIVGCGGRGSEDARLCLIGLPSEGSTLRLEGGKSQDDNEEREALAQGKSRNVLLFGAG
jgi:hypothetical protein